MAGFLSKAYGCRAWCRESIEPITLLQEGEHTNSLDSQDVEELCILSNQNWGTVRFPLLFLWYHRSIFASWFVWEVAGCTKCTFPLWTDRWLWSPWFAFSPTQSTPKSIYHRYWLLSGWFRVCRSAGHPSQIGRRWIDLYRGSWAFS